MAREDQYDIRVSVDGTNLGTWDVFTGGDLDTTELVYKPGAMAPQISLGGIVTVNQAIVNRLYQLSRDHLQVHWLLSRVGKGAMVISKQPLDPDGNAYGKPIVYKGVLKRCTPPAVDSNSTNPAVIELEMTPHGTVG
jgi:hypothetical protein